MIQENKWAFIACVDIKYILSDIRGKKKRICFENSYFLVLRVDVSGLVVLGKENLTFNPVDLS